MRQFKIFTFIIASLYSLNAFAQEKDNVFFGLNGGISMPFGNWSQSKLIVNSTNFVNDPSGFAANGSVFALDGGWYFSKHFAIGAMINYASYKIKDLGTLSSGYQQSFDVDSVHTTAGSYTIFNFLPGIYFNYPIAKKLSVSARALAGITSATTPNIAVAVYDGGIYDGTFEQKSATKSAFGFDLGAGLGYSITKSWAVNLRADYFYSKPDFTINNTLRQNRAGRLVTEYNQPLTSMNYSFGVAYILSNK
ncbi:MAG TPA: outer membrane beta-barrel protein [Puia sp.]|jgi:opacity protein-like surface antigen|nr:outer membrane beta-barrel protein [Puia sp.]